MKYKVAVIHTEKSEYPGIAPYNPSHSYPEYPFPGRIDDDCNYVYQGVRDLFHYLNLDKENYGERGWNPLGHIVEPGMTVVIKPNLVLSKHAEGKDIYSIITHPSIIRAVADYCWIALKGDGKIIIADAPQFDCDFSELLEVTRLDAVCDFYSDFPGPGVEFLDLRDYWSKKRHFPSMLIDLPGDPQGTLMVDLGEKSSLCDCKNPERFYGAVYHREELIAHHTGGRQEYEVSSTVMDADVVISVPKMKVHKKVGVTLNMKNMVGIATNKNLCVHYTLGSPGQGGDQYPEELFTSREEKLIRLERWMYDHLLAARSVPLEYLHRSIYRLHSILLKPLGIKVDPEKRLMDAGNWYGNDSAWRMATDLLKIVYFSDSAGVMHDTPQRRLFSIVDGVIGGENNGPLVPDPRLVGVLAGGEDFLAVDLVMTRLMGFDYRKVKKFEILHDKVFNFSLNGIEDVEIVSNEDRIKECFDRKEDRCFAFKPHPGWVGHIEV